MRTLLRAGFVSVDEIDGALVVGFADRQFDTAEYFLLQRGLDSEDDDGVYLEHNGPARGTYGQVSSCSVSSARIEMVIDGETALHLQTEPTFEIELSCDPAMLHRLYEGLQRIFAGTDCRLQMMPADR